MRPTNEISDPVWQDIWDRDEHIENLTARIAAAEYDLRDSEARNRTSLEVIAAREQHIETQRVEIERLRAVEAAYLAASAEDADEIESLTARLAAAKAANAAMRKCRDEDAAALENCQRLLLEGLGFADTPESCFTPEIDARFVKWYNEAAKSGGCDE